MFGQNEIVGLSYFKEAQDDKLFITSMFMTLQGEGPLRGYPAFFIRFAKCNLACSFCDTSFDHGSWFTLDEIDDFIDKTINKFFNGNVPLWAQYTPGNIERSPFGKGKREIALIITGGEPMLQKNIGALLERFEKQFYVAQIESNGTVIQKISSNTILVVSPKCLEVNKRAVRYLKPNPNMLARADYLKFVMEADATSPYSSIPDWALDWRDEHQGNVFISPMNIYAREPQKSKELRSRRAGETSLEERNAEEVISFWEPGLLDMEANKRNHEYAANYAVRNGLIFGVQIHLLASLA